MDYIAFYLVCSSIYIYIQHLDLCTEQRWKYKYFVTLLFPNFQVSVLNLSIYFPENFLLLLPTFEHVYLYFLLFTFSKLAPYFRHQSDVSLNSSA